LFGLFIGILIDLVDIGLPENSLDTVSSKLQYGVILIWKFEIDVLRKTDLDIWNGKIGKN